MRYRYYAFVGSRDTPKEPYKKWFKEISSFLEDKGWIIRSGAADGADSYAESGIKNSKNKEIYLPWEGFNNHPSNLWHIPTEAYRIAEQFHPKWKTLGIFAKQLMARNSQQILGPNCDDKRYHSKFVICWTLGGDITGGTGQALRIANWYNIPIVNFGTGLTYQEGIEQIENIIKYE